MYRVYEEDGEDAMVEEMTIQKADETPLGELVDGVTVTSKHFKPCPFCGETTIYLRTGKDGCMNCPNCLVAMPNECNDHIELVHCWNSRVDDRCEYSEDNK